MDIRVVLNGKVANLAPVRQAIHTARDHGRVDVRVTCESGDMHRLVQEAIREGCQRLVVGGGDGSVKEIVDALMMLSTDQRPELAIMPLGTANDFAIGCEISTDLESALRLAQTGKAISVDCVRANDSHFINVANAGFGAHVSSNTPEALKNFLGGGAYTLTGLVQALNFESYPSMLRMPETNLQNDFIVSAVCNGRQAGGGQPLAPEAKIDDGLLNVVVLLNFPKEEITEVISEFYEQNASGRYVKRYQVPWVEWESEFEIPINLDGEATTIKKVRFEVMPRAIRMVLPEGCAMLSTAGKS